MIQLGKSVGIAFAIVIILSSLISAQTDSPGFKFDARSGSAAVPFELFGNNFLVQAKINGIGPIWCIFDTGAGINVLNEKLAKRFGLGSDADANLGAPGGSVKGSAAFGATISLGGATATGQRIALVPLDILPQYFGRQIDGIVGTDFIQNFTVSIDQTQRRITLYDPKVYDLSHDRTAIPISLKGNVPYVKIELALASGHRVSTDIEIDTGCSSTLQLNRPFSEREHLTDFIPRERTVEGVGGAGLGGNTHYLDARIDSVSIGTYSLPSPIINISQDAAGTNGGDDAGILGSEVWRRFDLVIDYHSGKLRLRPNRHFREGFPEDLSGLELITAPGNFKDFRIKEVRSALPAGKAGLRADDRLLSVNGVAADRFGMDRLAKVFEHPGTCRLRIKRGDQELPVVLHLKPLI